MRLKQSKQEIMSHFDNNIKWSIKSRISNYGKVSELEEAVMDISMTVCTEMFRHFLDQVYTDAEFEQDIGLKP